MKYEAEFYVSLYMRNAFYKEANRLVDKATKKVIRHLQSLKDEEIMCLSEYGLENVWDEICAQQQGEHLIYWSIYEQTIIESIEYIIPELFSEYEMRIIYLQTEAYLDDEEQAICEYNKTEDSQCIKWLFEQHKEDMVYPVAYYILKNVLSEANNYTNRKIERYVYNDYN